MTRIFHWFFMWKVDPVSSCDTAVKSVLRLHYRPETVHCSTKDVYTSEITFLALLPCCGLALILDLLYLYCERWSMILYLFNLYWEGSSCDPLSGLCSCPPGFQGPNCLDKCSPGSYGLGCTGKNNCSTGYSTHYITGQTLLFKTCPKKTEARNYGNFEFKAILSNISWLVFFTFLKGRLFFWCGCWMELNPQD